MEFYRATWPHNSITPKMHMLEDHAVDFLRNWGASFGMYSEQGAESIHATFNYRSVYPASRRLQAMLKEHYMRVNPNSTARRPVIKKRKLET